MNTNHVKYFYDAFKCQSVVASAKINFVAASTVSQGINVLEEELGFSLTVKKKGNLGFTQEAVHFAKQAVEILNLVERSKEIKNSGLEISEGVLKIGTHQSFLNASLWKTIRKFKKQYPKVIVEISTGLGTNISNMIEKDVIDLAITADEINPQIVKHMNCRLLYSGSFCLVHSKKFNIDKHTSCIVTNLSKPEVNFLLKKAPNLIIESQIPSWTTIKKILQNEPLLGYLPDYLINKDGGKKRFKEVSGGKNFRHPYELKAWYSQKIKKNAIIQIFLDLIVD